MEELVGTPVPRRLHSAKMLHVGGHSHGRFSCRWGDQREGGRSVDAHEYCVSRHAQKIATRRPCVPSERHVSNSRAPRQRMRSLRLTSCLDFTCTVSRRRAESVPRYPDKRASSRKPTSGPLRLQNHSAKIASHSQRITCKEVRRFMGTSPPRALPPRAPAAGHPRPASAPSTGHQQAPRRKSHHPPPERE